MGCTHNKGAMTPLAPTAAVQTQADKPHEPTLLTSTPEKVLAKAEQAAELDRAAAQPETADPQPGVVAEAETNVAEEPLVDDEPAVTQPQTAEDEALEDEEAEAAEPADLPEWETAAAQPKAESVVDMDTEAKDEDADAEPARPAVQEEAEAEAAAEVEASQHDAQPAAEAAEVATPDVRAAPWTEMEENEHCALEPPVLIESVDAPKGGCFCA